MFGSISRCFFAPVFRAFGVAVLLAMSTLVLRCPRGRPRQTGWVLTPEQRRELWQRMTPEQRQQWRNARSPEERQGTWQRFSPEQRRETWQQLSPEQRELMLRRMTPEQRQNVRGQMTPDERRQCARDSSSSSRVANATRTRTAVVSCHLKSDNACVNRFIRRAGTNISAETGATRGQANDVAGRRASGTADCFVQHASSRRRNSAITLRSYY